MGRPPTSAQVPTARPSTSIRSCPMAAPTTRRASRPDGRLVAIEQRLTSRRTSSKVGAIALATPRSRPPRAAVLSPMHQRARAHGVDLSRCACRATAMPKWFVVQFSPERQMVARRTSWTTPQPCRSTAAELPPLAATPTEQREQFPQLGLQHLAVVVLRQRLDEAIFARALEARDVVQAQRCPAPRSPLRRCATMKATTSSPHSGMRRGRPPSTRRPPGWRSSTSSISRG